MLKEIRHIGIIVKDLEKSMNFYCNLLGFEIAKRAEEFGEFIDTILQFENTKVTTVKMKHPCSKVMIELLFYKYPIAKYIEREINDVGIGHIAFTVDDLKSEYKRLSNMGVVFMSEPKISIDGKAKVTFCRAPEGTFIELVQILGE